jgi:hypothetical protein
MERMDLAILYRLAAQFPFACGYRVGCFRLGVGESPKGD